MGVGCWLLAVGCWRGGAASRWMSDGAIGAGSTHAPATTVPLTQDVVEETATYRQETLP